MPKFESADCGMDFIIRAFLKMSPPPPPPPPSSSSSSVFCNNILVLLLMQEFSGKLMMIQ